MLITIKYNGTLIMNTTLQKINLQNFIAEFRNSLLENIGKSNPAVYESSKHNNGNRQKIMDSLTRKPFKAQAEVIQAVTKLLIDKDESAAIINAEMGTGKTIMAIATAMVMYHEANYKRHLIISPPHLVYKWKREILATVPNAIVWVLNGPETLFKLLKLRQNLNVGICSNAPEFFILGRVRMRMGYHWKPAFHIKRVYQKINAHDENGNVITKYETKKYPCCPNCFYISKSNDGNKISIEILSESGKKFYCNKCKSPMWTLMRYKDTNAQSFKDKVKKAMCQIPTIGPAKAESLINTFGEDFLSDLLADNTFDFVNLMDKSGQFIFTDKQARRMEKALVNLEFGLGESSYQATEFIKRYLPKGFFNLLIVDEGHEYKNQSSAQGLAMGVLATKVKKTLLLTGTLMGGYADDIFFLLFRILTSKMIEDGYKPGVNGTLGSASTAFMKDHGILKLVSIEKAGKSHKTAKGYQVTKRVHKAPGFGPKGILRYVLPYTSFLKLKDIGNNILPNYTEQYIDISMSYEQREMYNQLSEKLNSELKKALANRDTTLMGVVLNTLLAWPDCCAKPEIVKHPRTKDVIISLPAVFESDDDNLELSPKEEALIDLCLNERQNGRKCLVYATYTGTRDITSHLKKITQKYGLKTAVLKASQAPETREDWIIDKVDNGIDVIITNPELVKTGLDLLDFPTIIFLQTGFNVYTLQQAAKRSFRIGQKNDVKVIYLGYENSAQTSCLKLMSKKIAVSQSTSGDIPESGLDILNSDDESIEFELAKQLISS